MIEELIPEKPKQLLARPSEGLMGEHHVPAMLKQSGCRCRAQSFLLLAVVYRSSLQVSLCGSVVLLSNEWPSFHGTNHTLYVLLVVFLTEHLISGNKCIVN